MSPNEYMRGIVNTSEGIDNYYNEDTFDQMFNRMEFINIYKYSERVGSVLDRAMARPSTLFNGVIPKVDR